MAESVLVVVLAVLAGLAQVGSPSRAILHGSAPAGPLSRGGKTDIYASVENARTVADRVHVLSADGLRTCECDRNAFAFNLRRTHRSTRCSRAQSMRSDRSSLSTHPSFAIQPPDAETAWTSIPRVGDGVSLGLGCRNRRINHPIIYGVLGSADPHICRLGSMVERRGVRRGVLRAGRAVNHDLSVDERGWWRSRLVNTEHGVANRYLWSIPSNTFAMERLPPRLSGSLLPCKTLSGECVRIVTVSSE